ncbi:MAG: hypothetical protein IJ762_12225 [Bacteroidaceae bacterium]|nr:hypothetical protein [Bacteroidaceae bacterium]
MAQINQNGINFNNVKTAGVEMGQWPFFLAGQQGPDADGGIVNAVDIDWNGAVINGATMTTSGELVNAIKWSSFQECFANC